MFNLKIMKSIFIVYLQLLTFYQFVDLNNKLKIAELVEMSELI